MWSLINIFSSSTNIDGIYTVHFIQFILALVGIQYIYHRWKCSGKLTSLWHIFGIRPFGPIQKSTTCHHCLGSQQNSPNWTNISILVLGPSYLLVHLSVVRSVCCLFGLLFVLSVCSFGLLFVLSVCSFGLLFVLSAVRSVYCSFCLLFIMSVVPVVHSVCCLIGLLFVLSSLLVWLHAEYCLATLCLTGCIPVVVCRSICLSVFLRQCLSACLYICLLTWQCTCLSVYLTACLHACQPVCYACLSIYLISGRLSAGMSGYICGSKLRCLPQSGSLTHLLPPPPNHSTTHHYKRFSFLINNFISRKMLAYVCSIDLINNNWYIDFCAWIFFTVHHTLSLSLQLRGLKKDCKKMAAIYNQLETL